MNTVNRTVGPIGMSLLTAAGPGAMNLGAMRCARRTIRQPQLHLEPVGCDEHRESHRRAHRHIILTAAGPGAMNLGAMRCAWRTLR